MNSCRAIQQSDEMFCAWCNLRWDVNDPSSPPCKTEMISGDQPDLAYQAVLEKVAKGYHELEAIRVEQRKTMALMLKMCLMRVKSLDSRLKREGIAGLEQLLELLENA